MTSIGSEAFSGCSSLTQIVVGEGNPIYDSRDNCNAIIETASNTLLYGCQNTIIPHSVTSIGDGAFDGRTSLTSIVLPNSVTSIGREAFSGCFGLTQIVVEEGNPIYDSRDNCNPIIETASNTLLYGCQNTIIPHSVTSIGDGAFDGCISLTSIVLPNSVTSIGGEAFSGCSGLTSITIPNSVTSIGEYAFHGCSGLTSITIPNSVTSIGNDAFYGCSGLTSITIPHSVTSIGEYVFDGCSGLTSITIPNSVTSIGMCAFLGCSSLTSIVLPNSVTSIGGSAFSLCTSLTSITLPNSVRIIENNAFSGCSNLTNFYCYTVKPPQAYTAFYGFSIENATLHVLASAIRDYKSTAPWSNFGTIVALTDEESILRIYSAEEPSISIQAHDGNIVLQGAKTGTPVTIYSVDGMKVASGIVGAESALTLPTAIPAGEMVIIQFGNKSVKVIMK